MMSVLIGVVSALLIVALVVIVVLRVQCSQDDRLKRHKNVASGVGSLEHRGSVCGPTLNDKGGESFYLFPDSENGSGGIRWRS